MKIICSYCIAALLLLASCSHKVITAGKTGSTAANADQLKVLTYNIHHANPPSKPGFIDLDAVAQVIKNADADLIALQEVDKFTKRSEGVDEAKVIAEKTGLNYQFFKAIDYDGGEYGLAILSKQPLEDTKQIALPKAQEKAENRILAYADISLPGNKKITFACTHLDVQSDASRVMQVKTILNEFKEAKHPVILCGDLNSVANTEAIRLLDGQFKRTCIENCPGTIPATRPNRTIDYIAVKNAGWEISEYRVVEETYASDHRPVLTIFKTK
ncbi:endonuclease/exonuclease/phosphatase family protein [Pedobacter sp. BS3]|uniref:endonuclease/exonuclease/phosphatase family protein n=1 Tax=Pedobacter sp. BS3 TaxID=2567937 RepID=UPI0016592D51|nr:endonuclease/exonuclease/phosphatase family protein [Pedobacter sp. BS3]